VTETKGPWLAWVWAYHIKFKAGGLRQRIVVNIAWHLPREIAYWCFVRVASHATAGKYGDTYPDQLTVMDAMKRWDGDE
jgi:hypothetical protein